MDIKIDNTILDFDKVEQVKHKIDYRIILIFGGVITILFGYGLYKFRGMLSSKTEDVDFINIYDIFVIVLLVNIIIATLAISNFYYRIRVKGIMGQRGVRGKRGEKGKNASCNVYAPRLIKFKPEERPGKNIENVVDPSKNVISLDNKNKVYGVHYGWFPVEKKDIDNQTICRDLKEETACNAEGNCRYRNGKCLKKKVPNQMNVFMGSSGCINSQIESSKCYDTKALNMPYNKPINGVIVNNQNNQGDVKAIQFMYDKSQIPSEDGDNTVPLILNDVCNETGKMWNRDMYSKLPSVLDNRFCKKSESDEVCSSIEKQNYCLEKKCDWLNCSDIGNETGCGGKCEWNPMRRKCLPKDKLDRDSGKCKDVYMAKCNDLSNKDKCLESGCFWDWDGKCHDTYFGKRVENDDHENYDFKCQPNSAIYKIESLSTSDRTFGKGDLKPGVIMGLKFYCRDIKTGKHTQIYDKNNYLNDYIVIGEEPKPENKKYKYESIQCDIQVDEKNHNYPGFISNISALHSKNGVHGIGVNLCSYFKSLKG